MSEGDQYLSAQEKANYVSEVIRFLRENHSISIPHAPDGYNDGDRLEYWLGIPRNTSEIGDLFGIELKSWNGNTSIRFKATTRILSAAAERMRQAGWNTGPGVGRTIYYPAHHNGMDQTQSFMRRDPFFIAKTGDRFFNGVPNQWGRLRLTVNDENRLLIHVRSGRGPWMQLTLELSLEQMFSKYRRGLVVVQTRRFQNGSLFLQSTEVLLGVNTTWCIDQFRNGTMCLELRLKNRNNPKDPGQGFQLTKTRIDELRYTSDLVETDRSTNWICQTNVFL
jgi:hypothetical protein